MPPSNQSIFLEIAAWAKSPTFDKYGLRTQPPRAFYEHFATFLCDGPAHEVEVVLKHKPMEFRYQFIDYIQSHRQVEAHLFEAKSEIKYCEAVIKGKIDKVDEMKRSLTSFRDHCGTLKTLVEAQNTELQALRRSNDSLKAQVEALSTELRPYKETGFDSTRWERDPDPYDNFDLWREFNNDREVCSGTEFVSDFPELPEAMDTTTNDSVEGQATAVPTPSVASTETIEAPEPAQPTTAANNADRLSETPFPMMFDYNSLVPISSARMRYW